MEDFRLTYASLALSYPPLPRFKGGAIKEFAAEIDPAHPFESVRVTGDAGGVLETEGRRWLQLEREGLELQERTIDGSWELTCKRMVDLIGSALERFSIPIVIPQEVLLRALWPIPQQDMEAAALMRSKALGVEDAAYKLLGDNVRGGSVTVVGAKEEADPNFRWSVEIAPYLTDETQIWVELEANPLGMGDQELVEKALQGSFDFLQDNVMKFMDTVLS